MKPVEVNVLADDLTGAAEMAGVASRFGRDATMLLRSAETRDGNLKIWNIDSRLLAPAQASEAAIASLREAGLRSPENVFVKVDSVMRGHIRPQLEAMARELKARRIVLTPANPSKNRIIRDGQYLIDGVPLHETSFNSDPHHPAHSSNPIELLGQHGEWPVAIFKSGQALPENGFIIVETETAEDMAALAEQIDATTLVAGGADFFSALLRAKGLEIVPPRETPVISGPLFWVCGSTASPDIVHFSLQLSEWSHSIPFADESEEYRISEIIHGLRKHGMAILHTGQASEALLDPDRVAESVTRIVSDVIGSGNVGHLLLEGGATAAAVMQALEFNTLHTLCEWATGVVSFVPDGLPSLTVTLKPGSYRWPSALFQGTNFHSRDLFLSRL